MNRSGQNRNVDDDCQHQADQDCKLPAPAGRYLEPLDEPAQENRENRTNQKPHIPLNAFWFDGKGIGWPVPGSNGLITMFVSGLSTVATRS